MSAAKRIKQLMIERGVNVKTLAEKLEITPQSFSNKLFRDSFSFDDVVKIADLLGADVEIITRDTLRRF